MAKITPIDVIKGISGKYGSHTNDYFATNKSSNVIHLAKLANPFKGPFTAEQVAQQEKFKNRQAVATAWLNANKPTDLKAAPGTRAHDGSPEYQMVQHMKRQQGLSTILQVLYKHMDSDGKIVLPSTNGSGSGSLAGQEQVGGNTGTGTPTDNSGETVPGLGDY